MKVSDIEWVVRTKYGMTREQMRAYLPAIKYARPRQIAMFLARELTAKSYPLIGRRFNRDHSTVIAAERRIRRLIASNPKVAQHVEECRHAALMASRGSSQC